MPDASETYCRVHQTTDCRAKGITSCRPSLPEEFAPWRLATTDQLAGRCLLGEEDCDPSSAWIRGLDGGQVSLSGSVSLPRREDARRPEVRSRVPILQRTLEDYGNVAGPNCPHYRMLEAWGEPTPHQKLYASALDRTHAEYIALIIRNRRRDRFPGMVAVASP